MTCRNLVLICFLCATAPPFAGQQGNPVIQTSTASTAAQEEKLPVIYVKHLEPPLGYPPLPRVTRVQGTIVMKLKIGADGKVLTIESASSDTTKSAFMMLRDNAEKAVKAWTFGCVGCPPDAPFEHTIKFNYVLDDNADPNSSNVVMNLPDEVTVSAGPFPIDHGGSPPKKLKKGSH